tara:strand:+ start:125 stop:388 length:264 start_codon:yes stop_codon:yes gene_type:complete
MKPIQLVEVVLNMPKKKKETPYRKYPAVRAYMTEYNRMYYLANRAKIIADAKQRNLENEKQLKEYYQRYYAQNRKKLLNYAKKRRKT